MNKQKKNSILAHEIIENIGGQDNIQLCLHCATRLRLNLKDSSLINMEKIEHIEGVFGTQIVGEQLQIIIGQQVADVYDVICDIAHIKKEDAIDEKLDMPEKWTLKIILSRVLDGISGCIVPLIPVIISASFIKMFVVLLGPGMLNVITESSDLYTLLTFAGDAGFYFLPVYLGYTASKKFGVTPVIGMFLASIMIHPTLIGLVGEGKAFTVYGIPMTLVNYSSSSIPIILIIWLMSYVERLFKKYIPETISMVFVPLLTILVMLPIALCIVGPVGSQLGDFITQSLLTISSYGVIFAIIVSALSGALWNVLVLCGMHLTFYFAFLNVFIEKGSDALLGPSIASATIAIAGMTFASLLKLKGKKNKSLVTGYLLSHILGGVTEPSIFGIGIRYKKPFLGACLGGAAGSIYYALSGVAVTTLSSMSNFLVFTQFLGGSAANIVNGFIGGIVAFVVAALFTYFFGFKDAEINCE